MSTQSSSGGGGVGGGGGEDASTLPPNVVEAVATDGIGVLTEWLDAHPERIEATESTKGQTALLCCARAGSARCLELLLARGPPGSATSESVNFLTPLLMGCRKLGILEPLAFDE